MPPSNVPPVPSPLVQPTVPYVNPVIPHSAYLGSTFSPIPFGIPPPTDSTLPPSSTSSTLLPQNSLVGVQNPPGFVQTFAHVPPPLHQPPPSLQSHAQPPPPAFIKTQPPPSHIQSLPTHNIQTHPPLSHMHSQPPPSHMQSQHLPSHVHPPPSLIQTQPSPSQPLPPSQTYSQRLPLPPHKLFPTMHHQHATQQPPPMSMMPRAGMNSAGPPPVSASNIPNWHTPSYNRPPNTRPMGRGGWMR